MTLLVGMFEGGYLTQKKSDAIAQTMASLLMFYFINIIFLVETKLSALR
jgi:hypothetical protein